MSLSDVPQTRLTRVLEALGIATSSWYRPAQAPEERRPPGPPPREIPSEVEGWVGAMAHANPWYGYKRIAVMCRRAEQPVTNRPVYRVMTKHGLLQRRRAREAELYQAAKLYELLPSRPNELWQMDVTYVHIPGYGWWYAVTVIDYYSRYLRAALRQSGPCAGMHRRVPEPVRRIASALGADSRRGRRPAHAARRVCETRGAHCRPPSPPLPASFPWGWGRRGSDVEAMFRMARSLSEKRVNRFHLNPELKHDG